MILTYKQEQEKFKKEMDIMLKNASDTNWELAAQNCVDYRISASDIMDQDIEDTSLLSSLLLVIEMTAKLRALI